SLLGRFSLYEKRSDLMRPLLFQHCLALELSSSFFSDCFSNFSRRLYYTDSALAHDLHFCSSSIIRTTNDCTSVSHTASRRRCLTCDETYNWLRAVFFNPTCSLRFHATTDLTNHDDTFSFWIVH